MKFAAAFGVAVFFGLIRGVLRHYSVSFIVIDACTFASGWISSFVFFHEWDKR